uniref:Uncharacterized protein n=1 Tax=Arundo donax TaxID=35708 RepID=A0A0A8Z4A9_ARUDO
MRRRESSTKKRSI